MIQLPDFRGKLVRDLPLAAYTTWRVGGPAEAYAVPADLSDLCTLLHVIKHREIPLYMLGRGSNILIDDAGLPGLTIQLGAAFRYAIHEDERTLRVGADLPMPALAKKAAELGFSGFEHLIGIPGAVGAGIVINAGKGTHDGDDMRGILREVTYIDKDLQIITEGVNSLDLDYRSSRLQKTKAIVVEAVFALEKPGHVDSIQARYQSIMSERRAKFPLKYPNVGSVFKRPNNSPTAGWLIESAGLKGLRIGDAQISEAHANFIINLGKARSDDIRKLMAVAQEKVFQVHGVTLEQETIFLPQQRNW